MPRAYSTDLRERALAAYEVGEGRQSEIARAYRIGERTLSGWRKLSLEEERRAPKPRRWGTRPVGGDEERKSAECEEGNGAATRRSESGHGRRNGGRQRRSLTAPSFM